MTNKASHSVQWRLIWQINNLWVTWFVTILAFWHLHMNLWLFVAYDIRAVKIILSFITPPLDTKYELCGKILFFPFKGYICGKKYRAKVAAMGEVTASLWSTSLGGCNDFNLHISSLLKSLQHKWSAIGHKLPRRAQNEKIKLRHALVCDNMHIFLSVFDVAEKWAALRRAEKTSKNIHAESSKQRMQSSSARTEHH